MQNKGGIESVVSICNAKLKKGLVPGGIESVVSNCNAKKKAMGQAALSP